MTTMPLSFAPLMARFKASESTEAGARARALRAEGHHVVDFSIGEPDFPVPANVKEAIKQALDGDDTHYTNTGGTLELIDAVRAKLLRENGLEYSRDQIIIGSGAKSVMYHAFACTVGEGDEVIVPVPYWISYPNQVRIAGGTPVFVECGAEGGFQLDVAAIEAAITPRTRWLVLNSPNNPTGAMLSDATLAELAEMLARHPHVLIMSDEIYEHLRYGGAVHRSIATLGEGIKARTLVVNGVSKSYAMTGLRIGYGAGPAELVKAMVKLQTQTTSCASSLGQAGAVAALNASHDDVAARRAVMAQRRDYLAQRLAGIPGLSVRAPEGSMYFFCDCRGLLGKTTPQGARLESDLDFVRYLLDQYKLVVIQGSAYGCPGFFRISFATSQENLEEGSARLRDACAALG